jgi:nucleotide-binding universal stress UspA family protein
MAPGTFRRITACVDGSPHADRALDVAIDLAAKYGSEMTILAVAPLIPLYVASTEAWIPTEVPESEIRHYQDVVDKGVRRAESGGVKAVTGVCLEGVIVDEIIGHLDQHPADLLVIGSRGLSTAKRLLLGSVSDAVAHHVKCPVLIVRGPDAAGDVSPKKS